jgi:hypothetical protein
VYLDTDLGLHSASEDEPDKADIMDYPPKDKQEEPEEGSGSGSGSGSEREDNDTTLRRSMDGSRQTSTKATGTPIPTSNLEPPSKANTQPLSHNKPDEDNDNSATGSSFPQLHPSFLTRLISESEPDEPLPPPHLKRGLPFLSGLPPSKRVKSSPGSPLSAYCRFDAYRYISEDSSGTEEEPEIFVPVPVKSAAKPLRSVIHQESDSETQSEEELDLPVRVFLSFIRCKLTPNVNVVRN